MKEYQSLRVKLVDGSTETFEECSALVVENRCLVIAAGKEHIIYNADAWIDVTGRPKISV